MNCISSGNNTWQADKWLVHFRWYCSYQALAYFQADYLINFCSKQIRAKAWSVDLKSSEPKLCLSVLLIGLKWGNALPLKYHSSSSGWCGGCRCGAEPKHAVNAVIHRANCVQAGWSLTLRGDAGVNGLVNALTLTKCSWGHQSIKSIDTFSQCDRGKLILKCLKKQVLKDPILCSFSGSDFYSGCQLENVQKNTFVFSFCSLLQHLDSPSHWTLRLSACLFKAPPPKKSLYDPIGQLSQARAGTTEHVSTAALPCFCNHGNINTHTAVVTLWFKRSLSSEWCIWANIKWYITYGKIKKKSML